MARASENLGSGVKLGQRLSMDAAQLGNMKSSFRTQSRVIADPYQLDFNKLRKDYMKDSAFKLPFVKSSFIHYSQCPVTLVIENVKYDNELVLTMELVQAPRNINYTQLTDPKLAKQLEAERKKKEAAAKKAQEKAAKKSARREEKKRQREEEKALRASMMESARSANEEKRQQQEDLQEAEYEEYQRKFDEKQKAKEEREQAKFARRLEQRQSMQRRINGGSSDEENDKAEESDYGDEESHGEMKTFSEYFGEGSAKDSAASQSDEEDSDGEDSERDQSDPYGNEDYSDSDDSDDDDDDSDLSGSSGGSEGEDREYTGDMFSKSKPIKFQLGPEPIMGNHNKNINVNEYVCFSIWRNGGADLRYCRLKDAIIPIPPLQSDKRFRTSHTCKSVYYIGEEIQRDKDGKEQSKKLVLVVITLKDLKYKTYDLEKTGEDLKNLQNSSLIMNDTQLCFQRTAIVQGKHHAKEQTNFTVFDLEKQENIWTLEDCERVFFSADAAKKGDEREVVNFGEDDEYGKHSSDEEDNFDSHSKKNLQPPSKIFAIQKKKEICAAEEEDDKKKAEENKEGQPEAAGQDLTKQVTDQSEKNPLAPRKSQLGIRPHEEVKMETRMYFRTYQVEYKKQIDFSDEDKLKFETYTSVAEGKKKDKKNKNKEQVEKVAEQTDTKVVMATLAGQAYNAGINIPPKKKKNPQIIEYAVDKDLEVLCIIVMGSRGEQHRIFQFNSKQKIPLLATQRAGNTFLEFNQDWHLREAETIFLVQTENNGMCTAKKLDFNTDDDLKKMPTVTLKNASKQLIKDVWIMEGNAENKDEDTICSLCKSSTDDFLQCEALDVTNFNPDDPNSNKNRKQKGSKIRCQEIDINYPCLVYNIGLRRIKVQSMAFPDMVATFSLIDRDFLCFASYRTFSDVGLKDKRTSVEKEAVPFEEAGQNIAFLTRNKSGRDGEIFLNILKIDTFSTPMKFELLTTEYEAGMDGGIRDDCIYQAFVMQVTSVRGLDVSFVCQYNDAIIFDCITSTKQQPIRFPMPKSQKLEDKEKYFNNSEKQTEWEYSLDICKGASPMKQPMQMDDNGAIYFVVKTESGLVKVIRVDPNAEMGNAGFVKSIYSLRCQDIHFLEVSKEKEEGKEKQKFYLMDEKKKIRVLEQDPLTFMLTQVSTLEMTDKDKLTIKYSDFDEFIMSSELMHWDNRMIYLHESKNKDEFTYGQSKVMLENHTFISGPKVARGTGMCYYLEKYENFDEIGDDQENQNEQNEVENIFKMQMMEKSFKGFSIIMQPISDLSYIDLIPQLTKNHNNFSSYIDSEHILIRFSGRFLIYHHNGKYCGQVVFEKMEQAFRQEQLQLVCVSDNVRFFVFEGPVFVEKAKKEKNEKKLGKKESEKPKPIEPAAGGILGGLLSAKAAQEKEAKRQAKKEQTQKDKILYVFKLVHSTNFLTKKQTWKFIEHEMKLDWIVNPEERHRTRQNIDHRGVFTQAIVKDADVDSKDYVAVLNIVIKSYESQPMDKEGKDKVQAAKGNLLSRLTQEQPLKQLEYKIEFDDVQRQEKVKTLNRKINGAQKKIDLGMADSRLKWRLGQYIDRRAHMDAVWVFTNHIIFKCGSELKYIDVNETGLLGGSPTPKDFRINFGSEVWIADIYSTGVDDLVQIFVINDIVKRHFIITWNLQLNREHSNFQSNFDLNTNPEYLFLRSYGGNKTRNFNMILDHGALINLQNNLPCQFFDIENEKDWCPQLELHNYIPGQKKVQEDYSKYLELTHPGRVQHFISYSDLTYWFRYEASHEQHELGKGKVSNFAPIARFPAGISIFHMYATSVKVLEAVRNSMHAESQKRPDDPRLNMLPLMFLHSKADDSKNKSHAKTTPLHLALDKQSPLSFEIMLELLKSHRKVCITSQLLDRLEDIINQNSQVVNEFFDESFFVTDQFNGPQALDWTIGEDKEEHMIEVPTSFMTSDFLQSLVKGKETIKDEEDYEPEKEDDDFQAYLSSNFEDIDAEGPAKYVEKDVEEIAVEKEDTSNLRQVEAKLLEFNWIFVEQNAQKFITILSETENDDIFATKQIRVLILFLWSGYSEAIMKQLFFPFLVYACSFSYYVTYLSKEHHNEFTFTYCLEMAVLVIAGKMFLHFCMLEAIQISIDKLSYFTDFWNMLDLASLVLNVTYVYCELTNAFSEHNINVVGSLCVGIMWFKMFYWMRIFQPFAAFIRMVEAIIKHIGVFSFMLLMVLAGFANIIIVLQLNRTDENEGLAPIFDPLTDWPLFDAMIHAYLTGLGDFNKDTYSERNNTTVWIFFLIATVIVQLVFMNLLIALMADAYAQITAIQQQSILKELCSMMEDHIWLLDIGEIFKNSRYILWLTPDRATSSGSATERKIEELREFVEGKVEASDTKILREIQLLSEDIESIKTQLTDVEQSVAKQGQDDEDDYGDED